MWQFASCKGIDEVLRLAGLPPGACLDRVEIEAIDSLGDALCGGLGQPRRDPGERQKCGGSDNPRRSE